MQYFIIYIILLTVIEILVPRVLRRLPFSVNSMTHIYSHEKRTTNQIRHSHRMTNQLFRDCIIACPGSMTPSAAWGFHMTT